MHPGDLDRLIVRVAEDDGRVLGFSAVDVAAEELELLFVEPDSIGSGVGKALLADASARAAEAGLTALLIESDPDAEAFYLAAGAVRIGTRVSSATGRTLPLLRIGVAGS